MRLAAYVYPGWHPIAERDESFHPGFTEWELVYGCRPRFDGHAQPRVPAWGRYDDRDPLEIGRRVRLAAEYGVDAFVYGFFWCRGKRVFQAALDDGFLGSAEGASFPFAVMWANRMSRRVLPVPHADGPVIDEARRVSSDVDDFVALVAYLAERYFKRDNYIRVGGKPYFSIFDSSFFIRELGLAGAAEAIARARAWLVDNGLGGLYLAAIEPARDLLPKVREIGFDCLTNYVYLPYWKGDYLQDYAATAARRAAEWPQMRRALPDCHIFLRCRRSGTRHRAAPISASSGHRNIPGGRSSSEKSPIVLASRSAARSTGRARLSSSPHGTSGANATTSSPTSALAWAGWRRCATSDGAASKSRSRAPRRR